MPSPTISRTDLLLLQQTGKTKELRRALRRMRWSRVQQLWIGFGLRLGHIVSPRTLGLLYLTLFLPFGLIGRLTRRHRGWRRPRHQPTTDLARLRVPA